MTSILVTLLLPLLLYPFAKTTWAAVDLLLHGPGSEPDGEGGPEP